FSFLRRPPKTLLGHGLGAKATGEGSVFGACPWIHLLHFQIGRNLQIVLMLQIGYLSLYAPHHIPWAEINHHTQIVITKVVLSRMLSTKPGNLDKRLAESTWQCPPCDEDWDKDLWEQTSTPFLWGTAIQYSNNSPASNIVMECKPNLASCTCVPKSLPMFCLGKNSGNPQ
uniref:Uncharacterized protein n=1 Tax=Balaenoptera musculus TaxID=9771 RepID=A0A8C0CUP3_BALMU